MYRVSCQEKIGRIFLDDLDPNFSTRAEGDPAPPRLTRPGFDVALPMLLPEPSS